MEKLENKIKKSEATLTQNVFLGLMGVTGISSLLLGGYLLYTLPQVPKEYFYDKQSETKCYAVYSLLVGEGAAITGISYMILESGRKKRIR